MKPVPMTIPGRYAKKVLEFLYGNGPATRSEIMNALRMRQNSLVEICHRLETAEIILKTDRTRSRNIPLYLNPLQFAVLGVEHGEDVLRCVMLDGGRRQIDTRVFPLERTLAGRERMTKILSLLEEYQSALPPEYRRAAIGFAEEGMTDTERGTAVFSARIPGWKNLPVTKILTEKFHVFARIVDRTGGAAFASCVRNPGNTSFRDSIQVWISTGIGASILFHGKFWGIGVPSACQIGHIVLNPDGALCGCGNRGCLETAASVPAVLKRASSLAGHEFLNTRELLDSAAKNPDGAAQTALREAADALGLILANTVNFSAIPNLIVRGEFCGEKSPFPAMLETAVRKSLLAPFRDRLRLSLEEQKVFAPAEGAALYAQQEYFSSTETTDSFMDLSNP